MPEWLLEVWRAVEYLAGPEFVTPWTLGAMLVPLVVGVPLGLMLDALHRRKKGAKWTGLRSYFTEDPDWTLKAIVGSLALYFFVAKFFYMNIVVGMLIGLVGDNMGGLIGGLVSMVTKRIRALFGGGS